MSKVDPDKYFGPVGTPPATPAGDTPARSKRSTNADDYFGPPAAPPPPPEPGILDRVVAEVTGGSPAPEPRKPGEQRGGKRTEAKPYVAGDERAKPPEPGGSVLDQPSADATPPAALIEQRGSPVAPETFSAIKASLSAMPKDARAAQVARKDLPGWMKSAMAAAYREIQTEDNAAAASGIPGSSLESRAQKLMDGGMRGDVASGVAQNEALGGSATVMPAQAKAIESLLTPEQEAQAKAEGRETSRDSIALRGIYQAGQGLKQSGQGAMAMVLRAAGDEEGAKLYEAEGAKSEARVQASNELTTMRQRAGELGIVNTGPADYLERMGVGAMNSVGLMLPGMAAGGAATLATGNPVLGARVAMGLMSSQVFGMEYIGGRSEGLSPTRAAGRAAIMASLEYVGERYGLIPQAMRKLAGKASEVPLEELPRWAERAVQALEKRKLFSKPVGVVVRGQVGEQIGEQITGGGQYLVDGTALGLDQAVSLGGFLENARDTAVQTLIATGVLQAGGAAGGALLRRGDRPQEIPPTGRNYSPPAQAPAPAPFTPPPAGAAPAPATTETATDAPLAADDLLGTPVDEAAHGAATSPTNDLPEPTDDQKKAGNYKLGHLKLGGLDISIENPQGSVRRGVDEDGKAWENTLQSHYGYIRRTEGADGDHVDTFIKPGTPPDYEGPVFVVDQRNPQTGAFDEHKVMLGYESPEEAEAAYRANYAPDWQGLGYLTGLDMPAFKEWVKTGNHKVPFSAGFKETTNDNQPDMAGTPAVAAGARDGAAPAPVGSGGNLGPLPAADGGGQPAAEVAAPGSAAPGPVGDGASADAALSDTPDFETTYPAPRFDDLNAAGRDSAFVGLEDDPKYLAMAVRGLHQEVQAHIGADLTAARMLRQGIADSIDPATGQTATPERLTEMQGELTQALANVDGTLEEYAREFGDQHRTTFTARVAPDLEQLRTPAKPAAPAAPANDAQREADAALDDLGKLFGKEPAAAPPADEPPAEKKARVRKQRQSAGLGGDGMPRTILGSTMLGEISRQLGGISPDLLRDLSFEREFGKINRNGRRSVGWFNPPAGKNVRGGLFRDGGIADTNELAEWMESEGYITPGTYERDYKEADELARQLVRAALEGKKLQALDPELDDWERRRQEAMGDPEDQGPMYPDLDPEAAAEAEAERRAMMEEVGIEPSGIDLIDDDQVSDAGSTDRIAALRAMGATDEEIAADEAARQAQAQAGDAAQAPGPAPQEPGEVRPPDEPGSPASGPEAQDFDLTSQTEEQLRAIAEREAAARRADEAEQRRLADKAKADAQLDEFVLTGSDRPADLAAAAGQGGLFDAPPVSQVQPARDETVVVLRKRLAILKQLRECLQS